MRFIPGLPEFSNAFPFSEDDGISEDKCQKNLAARLIGAKIPQNRRRRFGKDKEPFESVETFASHDIKNLLIRIQGTLYFWQSRESLCKTEAGAGKGRKSIKICNGRWKRIEADIYPSQIVSLQAMHGSFSSSSSAGGPISQCWTGAFLAWSPALQRLDLELGNLETALTTEKVETVRAEQLSNKDFLCSGSSSRRHRLQLKSLHKQKVGLTHVPTSGSENWPSFQLFREARSISWP